uniref:Coat protein n=1 Tax=Nerine virus X TaxID=333348 RepID=G9B9X3_9VIRU|nr:coat protein [Nerine virus X]
MANTSASAALPAQSKTDDMTAPPDNKDLEALQYIPESNAVATADQIHAIAALWKSIGVPAAKLGPYAWDLARHCAMFSHHPSQIVGTPPGESKLTRQMLAASIKSICTLRQFCMYFAPVVWNMMILTDQPPANWSKLNYRESERFAAFDFFDGVTHTAALHPIGGLIRPPSEAERVANAAQKGLHIYKAAQQKNQLTSTAVEFTRAQVGSAPSLTLLPPN